MSDDHAYNRAAKADKDDTRVELAQDRTDMAEDRTVMAVERTYAGWIRTAFGAIAIGLGFKALFGELDPPWLAKAIATVFIALAILLSLNAQHHAVCTLKKMKPQAVELPGKTRIRIIAYCVAVGAALLIAGLWLLNDGDIASSSSRPG